MPETEVPEVSVESAAEPSAEEKIEPAAESPVASKKPENQDIPPVDDDFDVESLLEGIDIPDIDV